MRVVDHPILGKIGKRKRVKTEVDGNSIEALEGEPIAAALIAAASRSSD